MKLKTPFADEVPPLSEEAFEALKADIKANGQQVPVFIDEDANVLDGHHRYKILGGKAKTTVVGGLSEPQKRAFVHRWANNRRNLSPDQRREQSKRQQAIAVMLREEDPKRWTQAKVAAELGVSQKTVSVWLGHSIPRNNVSKPDARVKVSPQAAQQAVAEVKAGKPKQQVAANLGVSEKTVSRLVAKDKPKPAAQRAAEWSDSETQRRNLVEIGECVVANISADKNLIAWAESEGLYVRADRQTDWGNPYVMDDDGDRGAVCDKFAIYFEHKTKLNELLPTLRGKVLGCWCYPDRCHAQHIAALVNEGLA